MKNLYCPSFCNFILDQWKFITIISSKSTNGIWRPWSYSIRTYLYHHIHLFGISIHLFKKKQIPKKRNWEILPAVLLREVWAELRTQGQWQALKKNCSNPQAWGLPVVLPGPRRAGALEEGAGRPCSHAVIWSLPENGRKGVGKELKRCILTSFLSCLWVLAEPFTGPNLWKPGSRRAG